MVEKVFIYPSLGNAYSMKRYVSGLEEGLKSLHISYEIVKPKDSKRGVLGIIQKYLSYSILAYNCSKKEGRHIIVSERYSYLLRFMRGSNATVICHDLHTLYSDAPTPLRHRLFYKWLLNQMKRASSIVCVSRHTLNDLKYYIPRMKSNSLNVIHNGIEEFWIDDNEVSIKNIELVDLFKNNKVILSVGTDAWYKDFNATIQTLNLLGEEYMLLRVGEINNKSQSLIDALGVSNRLKHVQFVKDTTLKFFYQNAHCFLFPSISEGFGWPAVEAVLCGCPVITTGHGAIREVMGESAVYVNNIEEMVMAIEVINEPAVVKKVNVLTWRDQVKQLLAS